MNGNAITLGSSPLSTVCAHCGTKLRPVLEEFASDPAIAKRFAQRKKAESVASGQEVFSAASSGDQDAVEILTSAGEALGVSAAFLVNVLDPQMIIVGGGLGKPAVCIGSRSREAAGGGRCGLAPAG